MRSYLDLRVVNAGAVYISGDEASKQSLWMRLHPRKNGLLDTPEFGRLRAEQSGEYIIIRMRGKTAGKTGRADLDLLTRSVMRLLIEQIAAMGLHPQVVQTFKPAEDTLYPCPPGYEPLVVRWVSQGISRWHACLMIEWLESHSGMDLAAAAEPFYKKFGGGGELSKANIGDVIVDWSAMRSQLAKDKDEKDADTD